MDGSKDRRLVLNSLLKESWAGWACKRVIGRQIFLFFLAPLSSMILITLQGGSTSFHEKAERSSMRHPDDCITWLRWEARDCRGFSKIWGDEKAVHRRSHRDKSRNAAHLQLVAGTRQLTSTWASSSPSNSNNKLYSRLLRPEGSCPLNTNQKERVKWRDHNTNPLSFCRQSGCACAYTLIRSLNGNRNRISAPVPLGPIWSRLLSSCWSIYIWFSSITGLDLSTTDLKGKDIFIKNNITHSEDSLIKSAIRSYRMDTPTKMHFRDLSPNLSYGQIWA